MTRRERGRSVTVKRTVLLDLSNWGSMASSVMSFLNRNKVVVKMLSQLRRMRLTRSLVRWTHVILGTFRLLLMAVVSW